MPAWLWRVAVAAVVVVGAAPTAGAQQSPTSPGPDSPPGDEAGSREPRSGSGDPSGGSAAGNAPGDEGDIEQARTHMERGQELFVKERFADAAEQFTKAFEAKRHSAFLYNAALAHERAGEAAVAADHFARYLSHEPDAEDAASVRERIERLRTEALGDGEPEPGAEPRADAGEADGGEPDRTRGDEQKRDPGDEATQGAEPADDDAQLGPDAAPTRGGAPAVPAEQLRMKSLLSIKTQPSGARVTVEHAGKAVAAGEAPLAHALMPGDYRLRIEHPDYRTVEEPMTIGAGKVYVVIVEMSQAQFLGFLRVVTRPAGAEVYLDDRAEGAAGKTPWQNAVATGEHELWIERPGYKPERRTVDIGMGEEVRIEADLERVDHGRLRVVANVPGASVFVDGERVGEVPYEGDHAAGPHGVRVEADGRKTWEQTVELQRGQLTPIRVQLRPAVDRGGAWAATVVSAALAGGGLALMLLADDLESDLEKERNRGVLESSDSRIFKGRMLSIASNVAFGLSGLTAVLAVYYFVRDPLPDSEAHVLESRDWALAPQVGPYGAGAKLRWSF